MFKETRKKYNLKQIEMAEILEVNQNMISQYETGIKKPGFDILFRFHKKFGIEELTKELNKEFEKMKNEENKN